MLNAWYKKIVFLILLVMIGKMLNAQDTLAENAVLKALKSGNASLIAENFDNTVNIIMPESSGNYGKKQATQIMKYFFDHNPQKDFQLEMFDNSENHSTYIIGRSHSFNGKTFRILCVISHLSNQNLIRQIQIEEL